MKLGKSFLGISVLAAIIGFGALGGVVNAAAPGQNQTPGSGSGSGVTPHPVRLLGRVNSVSSSGLVLQTRRGNVNVNVGDRTWIVVPLNGRCAEGTLQDIQTGRPAEVMGMTTTITATVDARVIAQGRCMGPAAAKALAGKLASHLAAGTVKAINGNTLTVTTLKGNKDVTVNTTADTVVFNNGFQSVSTVKVGDSVQVFGRPDKPTAGAPKDAPRTLTAWALHVASASTKMVIGRVDSVNGNTITLKTPKDRAGISVTLDSKTGYKALTIADQKATLANASQADIKAGSRLVIEGASSADGKTLTAKAVVIMPSAKN